MAVAGVSLALAGVFLVQYGVEQGLLTPTMRVLAALGLGAALVVAGDLLRRRHGDAAAVPSGLAGAGLVVLFAAVLAARALYGLIGPGPTLGALVAVAALAIVLGWFHGPVLSALGLSGAGAAPFLVGGESAVAWLFYPYFALLAVVGLAVDAARHWRWLSWLALAVAGTGAGLLYQGGVAAEHVLGFLALVTLAAVLVPGASVHPATPRPRSVNACWRAAAHGPRSRSGSPPRRWRRQVRLACWWRRGHHASARMAGAGAAGGHGGNAHPRHPRRAGDCRSARPAGGGGAGAGGT